MINNYMQIITHKKRSNSEVHQLFQEQRKDRELRSRSSLGECTQHQKHLILAAKFQRKVATTPVKSLSYTYNKWFISPKNRLKRKMPEVKINKSSDEYFYKQLFKNSYPNPQSPFQLIPNQKISNIQKIPAETFIAMNEFRKNQIAKRKRVPEIVEMFIKKYKQPEKKRFSQ